MFFAVLIIDNKYIKEGRISMGLDSMLIGLVTKNPTATFNIELFLQNATAKVKEWGGYLIVLLGAVLLVVAVWILVTGLMSHGKKQTNWAMCIIMFIIGGCLVGAGVGSAAFTWVQNIAAGGKDTIESLGGTGNAANNVTPTIVHIFK